MSCTFCLQVLLNPLFSTVIHSQTPRHLVLHSTSQLSSPWTLATLSMYIPSSAFRNPLSALILLMLLFCFYFLYYALISLLLKCFFFCFCIFFSMVHLFFCFGSHTKVKEQRKSFLSSSLFLAKYVKGEHRQQVQPYKSAF